MILSTELLKKILDKVTSVERSNIFKIKMSLRNHEDPTYVRENIIIDQITFNQLFNNNVTDDIQVRANLFPEDLLELVRYQSAMYATLTIEYVDSDSFEIILDELPEVYNFRVFVHELEDIAKHFGITALTNVDGDDHVSEMQTSVIMPIDMQLIPAECYSLNKQFFNGQLSNVTVGDAIKYFATVMGIKRINMITPDNTTKFHHLYIPPEMGSFRVIFEYIQKKYGVYDAGLNYYFTNSILYVWPAYDVKLNRKRKLSVMKVNPSSYAGLLNYHDGDRKSDEVKIVSNTEIVHKTLSNLAAENDGNSQMFILADNMIDGQVDVSGDNISLNNVSITCTNKVDNSINKNSAIPVYKKPTNNVFEKVSRIAESNTEIIVTGWPHSRLHMLDPGMPVKYIYDDKDTVKLKTGLLEAVTYTLDKSTHHGDSFLYTAVGSLVLRLSIDNEIADI